MHSQAIHGFDVFAGTLSVASVARRAPPFVMIRVDAIAVIGAAAFVAFRSTTT